MKKLFAVAMALFFMTATSGLVLAQGSTSPAPAAKTSTDKPAKKGKKSGKKVKKGKKTVAPATAPSTTAPAAK